MAKKFDFKRIGMKAAGVAAGAVVAEVATESFLENIDPKMRGIGKIVAGAVLPELAPKNAFLADAGSGVIANGAVEMYKALKPAGTSGVGDVEFEESEYVETVTGLEDDSPITGDDSPLAGVHGDVIVE